MDWNEFVNTFPIQLNQQQQEAVQSTEGAVLLLAVPGSGKTTVLVTRLGYMIYCRNIHPESILTVTYTVAATKDMSKRFADRFGEEMAEKLEFRTINGICAKIIQYYGRKIGKTPFELVKEEKNTTGMLVKICQEHGMGYPTESDLKNVRTMITYIKNMMLNDKEIQKLEEESDIRIRGIYQAYCSQMREKKWMDYDDQMLYAYKMLRMDSRLLEHFQNLYPYICVDEAQDTSKIQHAIIALLAAKSENLFMVGDEDQSIYGFRAAYPEALLDFEKDHPGARVLLMEENFRSNAKIVSAADKFIQKNTLRHEKHMKAAREAGADIRKISLKSRKAQYVYLMKIAQECSTETAVLYRDNECAIPLIDLLERKHIPYRMRNAELSFFTHRTVLDIQNIIRFAMNPKDTELFMQIYYRLKLFFRKEDALNYTNISKEKDIPIWDAILQDGNLEEYQQNHVRSLRRQMKKLLDMTGDKAVDQILVYMGYQDYLKKMGMNANKLEIVKMIGSREDSPEKLLERLKELERIIREKKEERECRFILSTMHASKGTGDMHTVPLVGCHEWMEYSRKRSRSKV
ncbi:MAG: ATP-dependent helicase [Dorea sp.]